MADPDHIFQKLCHEAVLECGSDVAAIERYVRNRIAGLDKASQRIIRRDLDRVLAFRASDRPARPH